MSRARDTSEIYVDGINDASDSAKGVVELATEAEAQAGTDATRAVTPAGLQSKAASTTEKGIVELATESEAQAGTDTTRAVTPSLIGPIDSAIVELGGDFNAGEEVLCTRIGITVTITGIGPSLAHASSTIPNSSAGAIPSTYRPTNQTYNIYDLTAQILHKVAVESTGLFYTSYRDSTTGNSSSASNTGSPPVITYNIT